MTKSTVILPLAKVMIAAAWADGSITNEEINNLKDLLFQIPDMTAKDWAELDIYIDSPVGEAERARLVGNLQSSLTDRKDQELALTMIDQLAHADGEIPEEEEAVVEEIKAAIREANANRLVNIGRFLGNSVRRRSQSTQSAPNRELYLEDFQKNRIFYNISRRLELNESQIEIPEPELRRLSLAGGLMARVAFVDGDVQVGEFDSMVEAIQDQWGLSDIHSALVVEVAVSEIGKGMDYYQLTRRFFLLTTEDERLRFINVLFAVADGDGRISYEETEEIRAIANVLKLTHKQFIAAKMLAIGQKNTPVAFN